ncbi:MAG TPA: DUF420 domain-containing protein [Campylobacterales bacterium]|nr:DUF420 domain-containing protein [Campylobacterales bacterium]HIP60470.1 DUF420 domain-containing protein [Campylobacterales bacterium]
MEGFLGTRGDFIVDFVMTVSGFLPFLLLFTFYLAANGRHDAHKYLQITLFSIVTLLVLALEWDVRFGNLSGISKQSPYAGTTELMVVFIVHLFFALTSFFGWLWLIIKSTKRYPTFFDFNHKKWGKIIFWDIVLMAVTGWMLYLMSFAS